MHLCPIDVVHKDIIFNLLIRVIEFSQSTILLANILQSTIPNDLQWVDASLLVIGPWLQKMKRLQVNYIDIPELLISYLLIFSFIWLFYFYQFFLASYIYSNCVVAYTYFTL